MNNHLVSVCLITYKQENYIQKAIENVFNQEVNFPIEFIISNDCSPDYTHEKIENIIKSAPQHITVKYFNHKENLGTLANFSFAINQCKGKYIAYFEGDDYWDYPKKLQTQVDFLEQNPDFAICCHNVRFLENDKIINEIYLDKIDIKDEFTIEDLAKHNTVPTLTAVFRNTTDKLPSWILESPIGDLPMFMMVAKHGKIKYINEKWAIYRSNIGVWSKMGNQRNLNMITQYDFLIEEFNDNIKLKKNLNFARNKYIKEYLKKEKLTIIQIFDNGFFKQLPLADKAKIIFRKYMN